VRDLMRTRGLLPFVMASITTITGLDIIVVYMPLVGTERGIDAGTIGLVLAIRAVASICARLVYVPLIDLLGRPTLTYVTILSPAIALALVTLPIPVWLIAVAMAVSGMGLGVSATLTLSGIVDLAPPQARATAMSLRLTGNRLGQALIPMAAGFVAAATGAGGVFIVTSMLLLGSAGGIWWSRMRR
jgi:MFS family permease